MDRSVHIVIVMTLGRPIEFDPEKALDAAVDVFWCKGYEATSMSDLLTAMKLSKSSLYQSFGGKRQLFTRCLTRYQERFTSELSHGLREAKSGRRFIEAVFRAVADTAQQPDGERVVSSPIQPASWVSGIPSSRSQWLRVCTVSETCLEPRSSGLKRKVKCRLMPISMRWLAIW